MGENKSNEDLSECGTVTTQNKNAKKKLSMLSNIYEITCGQNKKKHQRGTFGLVRQ